MQIKSEQQVEKLNKIWDGSEEGITMKRSEKKYAIGQKIPAAVKPFSRQEIENGQFSARHSSILRILTKWAQSLEDVFKNAEKSIKGRAYSFTTLIQNKLRNLSDDGRYQVV